MKTIPEFPNYAVTKSGRVWSKKRVDTANHKRGGHWLSLRYRKDGRIQVGLYKNNVFCMKYIHHLVLETYIGSCPDGMECCHSDGNMANNNLNNLRWDTHSSNVKDAVKHGTHCGLKNKNNAKLTEDDVRYIRSIYLDGVYNQSEIAKRFGVKPKAICDIVNKNTWKYL